MSTRSTIYFNNGERNGRRTTFNGGWRSGDPAKPLTSISGGRRGASGTLSRCPGMKP
jgi:hypothetical protein